MANVLVTGGCGFIGRNLVSALIEAGHTVTVIDDLSLGRKEDLHPQAKFMQGNVLDTRLIAQALDGIECCFHLAAIASVERARDEWFYAHQVNAGGIVNLFHNIAKSPRRIPVVYASSAAVYGDSKEAIVPENSATMPLTAYGADKLACEQHGRVASYSHHIPTIGLRFFNVYGQSQHPASPYSGVITVFRERVRQGLPLVIFGKGGQSRDFIYVTDAVQALLLAMQRLQAKDISYGVFNICTGIATSIHTLAQMIGTRTGKPPEIIFNPPRPDDIHHSCGDPYLSLKVLGFKTGTSLEEGLQILASAGD